MGMVRGEPIRCRNMRRSSERSPWSPYDPWIRCSRPCRTGLPASIARIGEIGGLVGLGRLTSSGARAVVVGLFVVDGRHCVSRRIHTAIVGGTSVPGRAPFSASRKCRVDGTGGGDPERSRASFHACGRRRCCSGRRWVQSPRGAKHGVAVDCSAGLYFPAASGRGCSCEEAR